MSIQLTGKFGPFDSSSAVGKSANAGMESGAVFSLCPSLAKNNLQINWLNSNDDSNSFNTDSGFAFCQMSDITNGSTMDSNASVSLSKNSSLNGLGDENGKFDLAHQYALNQMEDMLDGKLDGQINSKGINSFNTLKGFNTGFVKTMLDAMVNVQGLDDKANNYLDKVHSASSSEQYSLGTSNSIQQKSPNESESLTLSA